MDAMEEKLNAILSNPQMMQQIMSLAQNLGQTPQKEQPPQKQESSPALPDIDWNMLKKLSGAAAQSGTDAQQQSLLNALSPYLSTQRIHKLERAMRAAKMAKLASSFLGNGGLQLLTGR